MGLLVPHVTADAEGRICLAARTLPRPSICRSAMPRAPPPRNVRKSDITRGPVAIEPHRQNPLGTPWARLRPPTLGTCIERYDIFDGLICKDRRPVNPTSPGMPWTPGNGGHGCDPGARQGVVSSIFVSTFMYQFFKRRHQTAESERWPFVSERWPFVRVFRWAFPVKEILHGPARLGTFGQATAWA